jgi:ketosteroid isomerase-like protein
MKSQVLLAIISAAAALAILPVRLDPKTQPAPPEDSPGAAITAILDDQQTAWNRGDVDAFMKAYWDSPQLSFAGASGITRGWQPVLARYRKNYPDQKAMGHLDFSELEVHPLGKDAALVIGRWHLKRDSGELGGIFTLIFQRFPEGWRIIHDHTSLDAKTP